MAMMQHAAVEERAADQEVIGNPLNLSCQTCLTVAESMQNQEPSFDKIELLSGKAGINEKTIAKLKANGFHTVNAVLAATSRQLTAADNSFTETLIKKLQEHCRTISGMGSGFQTGKQVHEIRSEMSRISTGCTALDSALGGGIETSSMTELFGEFKTGKSQICHTMAVTAQIPVDGSLGGKVMFIDTEGTFRPERITQIAEAHGLDPDEALDNITYAKALNSEHQMQLLDEAARIMADDRFILLIVDSATALFRTDYSGRGELAERQQKLAKYLRRLHILAEEFGVAVVVTNQVTAKVDGMGMGGPQVMPIGGNIMAHAAHTRLSLRKARGDGRMCKIFDSPCVQEQDVPFQIGAMGVMDGDGT